MKNVKPLLAAVVFFVIASGFIASYRSFQFFLPAQQVELSHGVEYGAVVKDFLFVQEITLQKRFISRVDLYMAKLPSTYPNENVFILLDEEHRIRFTKRFSSSDFGEALYFPFDLGKTLDIGRGKKVYACIHSIDGDQGSYIGLAKKTNSGLGSLYVVTIVNNDIIQSFEQQQSRVDFTGSIGVRTFESNTRYFSLLQVIGYLLAFLVALLVFFNRQLISLIRGLRILPEYAFLPFSLAFGLVMLVITPPFMVPDEAAHFYRSYEVSELNLFKLKNEVPASLVGFASKCDRMRFSTHEKTTRAEILSMAGIPLNPSVKAQAETPDYVIAYVPQAFGIFVGKVLHLGPLWLMYLGRAFNLLISVILVFLAIRSAPVLKWVFFLLAVMPMTLYQFSSLSYDALTISLSFLLVATILKYSHMEDERISPRRLLLLFLLAGLLATAKPPYFLLLFCYFLIPAGKIGNRKKYILTFFALLTTALVISQSWSPGRKILERVTASNYPVSPREIFYPADEPLHPGRVTLHNPLAASLPLLPHTLAGGQTSERPADTVATTSGQAPQPGNGTSAGKPVYTEANPMNPSAQKEFILENPGRFIGIMARSVLHSAGLYAVGFVGLFGWVDTPVPAGLAYLYLFFLIFILLASPATGKPVSFAGKCLLLAIVIACVFLIETAMYLYCNPVGSPSIIAVQGRYFIAIAPVMLLLFYHGFIHDFIQKTLGSLAHKPSPDKPQRKKITPQATSGELLLSKLMPWVAILIAFATLTCSVYLILERYYVIAM